MSEAPKRIWAWTGPLGNRWTTNRVVRPKESKQYSCTDSIDTEELVREMLDIALELKHVAEAVWGQNMLRSKQILKLAAELENKAHIIEALGGEGDDHPNT